MTNRTLGLVLGGLLAATAGCGDAVGPGAAAPEEIAFLDHSLSTSLLGRLSVMSLRTGEVRVLAGSVLQYDWAPDGSQLVVAYSDELFGLGTVAAEGEAPIRVLLRRRLRILDPRWSHDGRRIAFAVLHSSLGGDSLWVVEADGGDPRPVADLVPVTTFEVARFAWLPGDTTILYQGRDGEYHRVDVRSGATASVTSGGLRKGPPQLSPDGGALVFECTTVGPALCTLSTAGSGLASFAADGYDVWHPSWSPDGLTIAFAYRERPDVQGALYVADRYGTEKIALTEPALLADVRTPIWSPDGRRIAYLDNRGSGVGSPGTIRVAGADGGGNRLVARDARLPAWRPAPR